MQLNTSAPLIYQVPRTLESAETLIEQLLADTVYFDAIVTSEDVLAVGAQRAARRNGRDVPVIGCNNSILAQCATPTLTSLDNKLSSLCSAAVRIVMDLTTKKANSVPVRTEFNAELVERESFQL